MWYVHDMQEVKPDIYNNWYVLNVTIGKEWLIKNKIEKYVNVPVRMTIFQREIFHTRRGKTVKVAGVLFSGYIFLHKYINEVLAITKKYLYSERIFPVSMNRKPSKVYQEEMKLLLSNADDDGLFRISRGKKMSDKVYFTTGALKNIQGNIIRIDEKKKKAHVEINLFKRKVKVSLGIDIIQNAS